MSDIRATNITWHEGHVKRQDRENLLSQKGVTIWFTGLSGSGKSTIAFTLEHAMVEGNGEVRAAGVAGAIRRSAQRGAQQRHLHCGEGAVRLTKVQRPGRAPVDGAAFLRGFALPAGQVLESGPCSAGN